MKHLDSKYLYFLSILESSTHSFVRLFLRKRELRKKIGSKKNVKKIAKKIKVYFNFFTPLNELSDDNFINPDYKKIFSTTTLAYFITKASKEIGFNLYDLEFPEKETQDKRYLELLQIDRKKYNNPSYETPYYELYQKIKDNNFEINNFNELFDDVGLKYSDALLSGFDFKIDYLEIYTRIHKYLNKYFNEYKNNKLENSDIDYDNYLNYKSSKKIVFKFVQKQYIQTKSKKINIKNKEFTNEGIRLHETLIIMERERYFSITQQVYTQNGFNCRLLINSDKFNKMNKKDNNSRPPTIELPVNTSWEDIEIKFCNAHYDKVDIINLSDGLIIKENVTCGDLYCNDKRKKIESPTSAWDFLIELSFIYLNKNSQERERAVMAGFRTHNRVVADIDNMIIGLKLDGVNVNNKRNLCVKIKEDLARNLMESFDLDEDPFGKYKEKNNEYISKFKISPFVVSRAETEVFQVQGQEFDEEKISDYEDMIEGISSTTRSKDDVFDC